MGLAAAGVLDRLREADVAVATRDSAVLFEDAPDPDDLPDFDGESLPEGITLVCLHCLINDHPEIGRGLDLAREYGVADLDDNDEWVVGESADWSSRPHGPPLGGRERRGRPQRRACVLAECVSASTGTDTRPPRLDWTPETGATPGLV